MPRPRRDADLERIRIDSLSTADRLAQIAKLAKRAWNTELQVSLVPPPEDPPASNEGDRGEGAVVAVLESVVDQLGLVASLLENMARITADQAELAREARRSERALVWLTWVLVVLTACLVVPPLWNDLVHPLVFGAWRGALA